MISSIISKRIDTEIYESTKKRNHILGENHSLMWLDSWKFNVVFLRRLGSIELFEHFNSTDFEEQIFILGCVLSYESTPPLSNHFVTFRFKF